MKKSMNFARRCAACLVMALLLCALVIQSFATQASEYVPIEQTEQVINGQLTLTKVFEVAPDADPKAVQEDGMEKNGYRYTLISFTRESIDVESTQTVSVNQEAVLSSSNASDAKAEAFTVLPDTIEYSQDGYTGVLVRDSSTVEVTETGRSNKTGTTTTTKTYEFAYNDESLIPNTITEDGKTYTKRSVSWTEGGYGENSAIPSSYIATVTYTRGWTQSVVDGYTAKATYFGEVTMKETTMMRYTAVYHGELIAVEVEEVPESMTGKAVMWTGIGGGTVALGIAAFMLLRKHKSAAALTSTATVVPDTTGGVQ